MALFKNENGRSLKKYLLDPSFQIKLVSYFVGLFIISTISLYSISYLFFWRLKQKALSVGIPDGHIFYKFLEGQKMDLDMLFIVLVLFNFILLIGTGIIISHRIAGPIYRLKLYLTTSFDNPSAVFKLRKKDFFKDLEPIMEDVKKRLK